MHLSMMAKVKNVSAHFSVIPLALVILAGSIADRTTGQPMPGVSIVAGTLKTVSRADGSFRLAGLKPGPVVLTLSSDDVPPQHLTVTVRTGTSRADLRVCSTTLDYNCGIPQ
jgi:hypothetical protein